MQTVYSACGVINFVLEINILLYATCEWPEIFMQNKVLFRSASFFYFSASKINILKQSKTHGCSCSLSLHIGIDDHANSHVVYINYASLSMGK